MDTNPDYLVYLHGFISSPQSQKAQETLQYASEVFPALKICVPCLDCSPLDAIDRVNNLIASQGRAQLKGFIGSSLGGFYAMQLAHIYDRPAVLVNPSIRPYLLLRDYMGEQKNPYTGRVFEVTEQHMEELQDLERLPAYTETDLMLVTQLGDETLDAFEAVALLNNQKMRIFPGGTHAFEGFRQVLPSIINFLI